MIELRRITKHFGDKKLFTDYSLAISDKEKVLLSAPSGSGKTTLIRLLMGFELPDKGDVVICNTKLDKHTLRAVRGSIAYVSQDTDLMDASVREQLETIFSYKVNRHITNWHEGFKSLCPTFRLIPSIIDEPISKLSGGERQRVALIIAILLDRPIMILDEITSGLDGVLKESIANDVLNLDKTVVIVSHDTIWKNRDGIREVTLI